MVRWLLLFASETFLPFTWAEDQEEEEEEETGTGRKESGRKEKLPQTTQLHHHYNGIWVVISLTLELVRSEWYLENTNE